jgi:hypothetical protein
MIQPTKSAANLSVFLANAQFHLTFTPQKMCTPLRVWDCNSWVVTLLNSWGVQRGSQRRIRAKRESRPQWVAELGSNLYWGHEISHNNQGRTWKTCWQAGNVHASSAKSLKEPENWKQNGNSSHQLLLTTNHGSHELCRTPNTWNQLLSWLLLVIQILMAYLSYFKLFAFTSSLSMWQIVVRVS